jgi:protein-tyrosine phosphatase
MEADKKGSSSGRDGLQPPEHRTFTKTYSMPASSQPLHNGLTPRGSLSTNRIASEAPTLTDFSSAKLGSAFWTAREHLVVKNRQGSVLTRGLIVKTDHFAGVRRPNLGVHLQGAPNFRQADIPGLQVYGVAQPTITGLKTILCVLQCSPVVGQRQRPLRGRHTSPRRSEANERAASATPKLGPPEGRDHRHNDDREERVKSPDFTTSLKSFEIDHASSRRCVWACTRNEPVIYVGSRPFVLREADQPFENFQLSERADNLESIEQRLKTDIIREAARYGGLLMVHEEDENGHLKPAWVAVGPSEVKTVREVFELIRSEGWRCDYHRIPIAEDQPMENNYLDAYTQIIRDMDPVNTAFVANCGAGVRRTSFAMVAAALVRRRQMILLGHADPFRLLSSARGSSPHIDESTGKQTPVKSMVKSLKVASEKQTDAQSTLQVVQVLSQALSEAHSPNSAVELLLSQPLLLDALRSAKEGNYGVIRQLVGLLDDGEESKIAVDMAIDACSHVIHLRHSILEARVRYALATTDRQVVDNSNRSRTANASISKAVTSLEQYHLLVTFSSYVAGSETAIFQHRFATWLRERGEISSFISRIRSKGSQLYFFDPIADLSALSKDGAGQNSKSLVQRKDNDPNMVPGDEFADHVVRNRAGLVLRPLTLLKEDIWRSAEKSGKVNRSNVRGAVNFRRIPDSNVFATGQPTVDGVWNILKSIQEQLNHSNEGEPLRVTFINLREEPICHINGKPYCLRQKGMSLRNIKSYSGISWSRLTLLEDRLKNDIINELHDGDGRLLLHRETDEGDIVPIWEAASPGDVETLQDVMSKVSDELVLCHNDDKPENIAIARPNVELVYRRVPITAEKPPDFSDIAGIMRTVLRTETQNNSCIVLNCQLGRGRSTLTSVIVLLISRWLKKQNNKEDVERPTSSQTLEKSPLSYHIINSLLRVIPHGLTVKETVDEEINRSAGVVNMRDAIEESRLAAEDTEDAGAKKAKIQSGIYNLRRYFELIVFQAYLEATPANRLESLPTFENYVKNQPVFYTLSQDFDKIDLSTITPLQKVETSDGMALNEEVQEVVSNRSGVVLSAYTMLKSDLFPGLAAQALSQIEGIPNMRGVGTLLGQFHSLPNSASFASMPPTPMSYQSSAVGSSFPPIETWGHGMPSVEGLRKGLEKIGAGPKGSTEAIATSLREEAVCVVNGRPHVLRLADQPFTNMEATGITTEAVERMEKALKQDVIKEIQKYNGRILLHDEVINEQNGKFEIIPVWESVKEEDVLTPSEMYKMVRQEGFRVNYARVAVTDEQAPIPAVFHELEERVLQALRMSAASVWNCQMGRGRTTTGMVIASLVSTVAHYGEELFESDLSASIVSWSGFMQSDNASEDNDDIDSTKDALDNREDELWLQGEYRSVLQLVAILRHGKLAKKLTDAAIDRMDAVQNLRKAIYDSKLRASNADAGTAKYRHLHRVYVNYLQRYSYLIVFANYLLEKSNFLLEKGGGHFDHSNRGRSLSRGRRGESEDDDDKDDGDDDDDTQSLASTSLSTSRVSINTSYFASEESRQQFPTFVNWLQPRREITKICATE